MKTMAEGKDPVKLGVPTGNVIGKELNPNAGVNLGTSPTHLGFGTADWGISSGLLFGTSQSNSIKTLATDVKTLQHEIKALATAVKRNDTHEQLVDRVQQLEESATNKFAQLDQTLKADVLLPSDEVMKVKLVPLHYMERLDEYRSDENWAFSLGGIFLGALLGIITNGFFTLEDTLSSPTFMLLLLFSILTGMAYLWGMRIRKRVQRVHDRMALPIANASENEL